jgi:hypothetical protein
MRRTHANNEAFEPRHEASTAANMHDTEAGSGTAGLQSDCTRFKAVSETRAEQSNEDAIAVQF